MNEIKIIVSGGCVVDVEGLPEGWEYTVADLDTNPEEDEY